MASRVTYTREEILAVFAGMSAKDVPAELKDKFLIIEEEPLTGKRTFARSGTASAEASHDVFRVADGADGSRAVPSKDEVDSRFPPPRRDGPGMGGNPRFRGGGGGDGGRLGFEHGAGRRGGRDRRNNETFGEGYRYEQQQRQQFDGRRDPNRGVHGANNNGGNSDILRQLQSLRLADSGAPVAAPREQDLTSALHDLAAQPPLFGANAPEAAALPQNGWSTAPSAARPPAQADLFSLTSNGALPGAQFSREGSQQQQQQQRHMGGGGGRGADTRTGVNLANIKLGGSGNNNANAGGGAGVSSNAIERLLMEGRAGQRVAPAPHQAPQAPAPTVHQTFNAADLEGLLLASRGAPAAAAPQSSAFSVFSGGDRPPGLSQGGTGGDGQLPTQRPLPAGVPARGFAAEFYADLPAAVQPPAPAQPPHAWGGVAPHTAGAGVAHPQSWTLAGGGGSVPAPAPAPAPVPVAPAGTLGGLPGGAVPGAFAGIDGLGFGDLSGTPCFTTAPQQRSVQHQPQQQQQPQQHPSLAFGSGIGPLDFATAPVGIGAPGGGSSSNDVSTNMMFMMPPHAQQQQYRR